MRWLARTIRGGTDTVIHDLLEHALLFYATLPSHPGKGRIALELTRRFPSLSEFQGSVVRNGFRLQLDCRTQNVSDLILAYAGRYEVRDIRFMLEILRPGDCMLDVGANIGHRGGPSRSARTEQRRARSDY